jgi:peptide/nickel transport system substrate-binding protein
MRSTIRQRSRWLALFAAFAMVLAACGGDDTPDTDTDTDTDTEVDTDTEDDEDAEDEQATTVEGGTVLFGDEQEPSTLNSFVIEGNMLALSKVTNNIWPGAYKITPDFAYEPYLLDGEAEFTEDPFSVTYNIREDAEWSDGTPITANDFVFTYETIMDEANAEQITSTVGYELITDYEVEGDKTVTFNYSEPFAAWQLLFSGILPEHVLEGEDFLTFMSDELPDVSGGPYVFDSWDRGTQIRLVRNENYWDGDVALDEIIFRYVGDTTTLTQQMLGGELDMYDPQPQIELVEQLEGASDRVTYETGLGPVWEHIDFNTERPGLDQDYVRQAIAMGINRDQIVETLVHPVDPDAEVLQQPVWMTNQEYYEPYYEEWNHNPDGAIELLEENGCTRGDGDIFECDGERLSFVFSTTAGNERRELTQQLVQSDLAQVGIEITIENAEPAVYFASVTEEFDYDLALFAWVGSPDPSFNSNIFGCDDGTPRAQNNTRWCNDEATSLMDEANRTVDPEANADLWNQAAQVMADEVPLIPLFQQPQLAAWSAGVTGPQLNPTNQTIFWNSAEWARTE